MVIDGGNTHFWSEIAINIAGSKGKKIGGILHPGTFSMLGVGVPFALSAKNIHPKSNVILGQGVPEIVGVYARQSSEKYNNVLTFMESGVIGGIPERRPDFGVAFDPSAFLSQDNQFVGFNGGHMDQAGNTEELTEAQKKRAL